MGRMFDEITARAFHQSDGVEDWRVIGDGACSLFRTSSFAESVRLVAAVGALPGIEEHLPDIDIRHDGITVRLITMEDGYYGMSQRDVELARRVSGVARELGIVADPLAVQSVLVIPGAPGTADIMPFWRAALGYEPRADSPDEDLVDPHGRGPAFWFEGMDEPRSDGGGSIHVAVWLPVEATRVRVAGALAAGGHLVRDTQAPSWWTLADAAGNEVDIASVAHRD
jgi:4a-hydroxytetrahydrobiopterin dehydratase